MSNKKYVAFDVHLATIALYYGCVGKILWEGVFRNTATTIRDFLGGIRGDVHLTFEQGTRAAWLYDLVKPLVSRVLALQSSRSLTETNRIELMPEKTQRVA